MGFLMMFLAFIAIGLCVAKDKGQRRRFLGGVAALLYLPLAVVLAIAKHDK